MLKQWINEHFQCAKSPYHRSNASLAAQFMREHDNRIGVTSEEFQTTAKQCGFAFSKQRILATPIIQEKP
jgi:hypothetical protein